MQILYEAVKIRSEEVELYTYCFYWSDDRFACFAMKKGTIILNSECFCLSSYANVYCNWFTVNKFIDSKSIYSKAIHLSELSCLLLLFYHPCWTSSLEIFLFGLNEKNKQINKKQRLRIWQTKIFSSGAYCRFHFTSSLLWSWYHYKICSERNNINWKLDPINIWLKRKSFHVQLRAVGVDRPFENLHKQLL